MTTNELRAELAALVDRLEYAKEVVNTLFSEAPGGSEDEGRYLDAYTALSRAAVETRDALADVTSGDALDERRHEARRRGDGEE